MKARDIFEAYEQLILAGKWGMIPRYFLFQHGQRCQTYRDMLLGDQPMKNLSHCRLIFIYGPPGSGKTTIAQDFATTCFRAEEGLPYFMKPVSKWWDGYRGEPVVIMDDPSPAAFRKICGSVKVWADRTPFYAEIKGRSMKACPEWFVITSNYSIEELAGSDLALAAALRRRTGERQERLFHFAEQTYVPPEAPMTEEDRQKYRGVLRDFCNFINDTK